MIRVQIFGRFRACRTSWLNYRLAILIKHMRSLPLLIQILKIQVRRFLMICHRHVALLCGTIYISNGLHALSLYNILEQNLRFLTTTTLSVTCSSSSLLFGILLLHSLCLSFLIDFIVTLNFGIIGILA